MGNIKGKERTRAKEKGGSLLFHSWDGFGQDLPEVESGGSQYPYADGAHGPMAINTVLNIMPERNCRRLLRPTAFKKIAILQLLPTIPRFIPFVQALQQYNRGNKPSHCHCSSINVQLFVQ